jgi:hypothetical protein
VEAECSGVEAVMLVWDKSKWESKDMIILIRGSWPPTDFKGKLLNAVSY